MLASIRWGSHDCQTHWLRTAAITIQDVGLLEGMLRLLAIALWHGRCTATTDALAVRPAASFACWLLYLQLCTSQIPHMLMLSSSFPVRIHLQHNELARAAGTHERRLFVMDPVTGETVPADENDEDQERVC